MWRIFYIDVQYNCRLSNEYGGEIPWEKKTIKICMAGFGNVGVRFTRLLLEKERELRDDYGCLPGAGHRCLHAQQGHDDEPAGP